MTCCPSPDAVGHVPDFQSQFVDTFVVRTISGDSLEFVCQTDKV